MLRELIRARAIDQLGVLDGPREPGFDRIAEQAAAAFAAPMALLTLIRRDTMWVAAGTGLDLTCMPRRDGFCTNALDRGEPLEVCDALTDPRYSKLPSVAGPPYVRYYLGAPLTLPKGDVGALCIVDTVARPPATHDQRAYLVGLARQAAHALERQVHVRDGIAA